VFRQVKKSGARCLALGMDIGFYTIKAVILEETAEGPAVHHVARALTPAESLRDGVIVNQEKVAARLREIIRPYAGALQGAALSAPMQYVLVRWIDLPQMDQETLAAATRYEARKYLPFPVDSAEVVIVPTEPSEAGDEGRMRALLAAAPRNMIGTRAETLERAGLEAASVELEPLALLRTLNLPSRQQATLWRGQPQACIQIGEDSSGICVLQDMQLRFVRSISWGSHRLTEALAQELGCAWTEAQAILADPSTAIDTTGLFSWTDQGQRCQTMALLPELERLQREIQRLLNYYRSLFPERSYQGLFDRLILCGDMADLRGLDRYFAYTFRTEVSTHNPFQAVVARISPESFASIQGRQASFGVAIGLALGELQQHHPLTHAAHGPSREIVWRRKAA